MRKKIRVSIILEIAIVFLIAMSLSCTLVTVLGREYLLRRAVDVNMDTARAAANLVRYYLEPQLPFEDLSEAHREQTRTLFRVMCTNFHFKYIYVFHVYEEAEQIKYYICAAEDDEMDAEIQKLRPFGTIVNRPAYSDESKILSGEKDEGFQFVDNQFGNVCMYVFPLKDKDGNIDAIIAIDDEISDVHEELFRQQRSFLILVVINLTIAIAISLFLIKRVVISPIERLSERMRRFVKEKNAGIPKQTSLFSNEVSDIHESFDKMATDISEYIKDLKTLAADKARTETQFDVARRIQRDIIPPCYNIIGNGCGVFCFEKPAIAVGGDFYDVFYLNDKDICVIVGDISGKGISAALFMVMVKTNLRNYTKSGTSLAEVLNNVNREICRSNSQDMFATVFLCVLDTESGVLRYANAGHEKPLFLCEEPYYLNPESGMAIGLFEDAEFVDEECTLKDAEGILIYTDGIVESINSDHKQYGEEKLAETVKLSSIPWRGMYTAEAVVNTVVDSVEEYSQGMEQFDDITCVSLIYRSDERDSLILKPEIASFEKVRIRMMYVLGNSEESRNMILACEEMFSNIVNYSGTDFIKVIFYRVYDVLSVELIDNGVAFDPINAVIRNKDFLELDTGGMGIKLARMYSREMIYNRTEGNNQLILKFDVPEDHSQEKRVEG